MPARATARAGERRKARVVSNLPPISPDDIARAKAVPIMSVAEGYGLKLRSDRGVPCPACGGVDGFSVNTNKRVFNCRRGGVGGDVIELVRHVDGVDFRGAIERLLGGKIEAKQRQPEAKADGNEQAALAKALKSAARVVSGIVPVGRTPGEAYLRDVRKIDAMWTRSRTCSRGPMRSAGTPRSISASRNGPRSAIRRTRCMGSGSARSSAS